MSADRSVKPSTDNPQFNLNYRSGSKRKLFKAIYSFCEVMQTMNANSLKIVMMS